ncbi:hypothetical protein RIF29_47170 [Crotalaria pallida]|uniref:Uncharacterized protein n=1 Tax=Crotalaria pallida TaxID=3830 RepID=A0AAN9DTJ4_CROPI
MTSISMDTKGFLAGEMCCGRPDALLAAFQDGKSFSTFIGLAGLFIYQSKGSAPCFEEGTDSRDFLASLCSLPEPGLQSQSLPCFTHSLPSTGCSSSSIKTAGNLDDSSYGTCRFSPKAIELAKPRGWRLSMDVPWAYSSSDTRAGRASIPSTPVIPATALTVTELGP